MVLGGCSFTVVPDRLSGFKVDQSRKRVDAESGGRFDRSRLDKVDPVPLGVVVDVFQLVERHFARLSAILIIWMTI